MAEGMRVSIMYDHVILSFYLMQNIKQIQGRSVLRHESYPSLFYFDHYIPTKQFRDFTHPFGQKLTSASAGRAHRASHHQ